MSDSQDEVNEPAIAPERDPDRSGTVRDALEDALEDAPHLLRKHKATVQLARRYATYLDKGADGRLGDDGERGALAIAGPNLQKTLVSLGLTLETNEKKVTPSARTSKRDEVRAKRQQKTAG